MTVVLPPVLYRPPLTDEQYRCLESGYAPSIHLLRLWFGQERLAEVLEPWSTGIVRYWAESIGVTTDRSKERMVERVVAAMAEVPDGLALAYVLSGGL